MVNLSIQLEPNVDGRYIFLAGQVIKGVIKLSMDSPKKFRALYIAVRGKSEIHWTETCEEGVGENRRTVTHDFRNKEVYLDSKTILFGKIGGSSVEVHAGLHQYSFCCPLPLLLPYSLKTKHGRIEYSVETVLDVPWRFNKQCSIPFIVARFDDMNLRNDLKFGQTSEDMKTFCCCFCSSEPLILKESIPVLGFAIGQNIPIDIEYSNKSDIDVIRTEIKLKKIVKFTSSTPHVKTKLIPETVLEIFTDGVAKKSSIKFQCYLKLPTSINTSNEHCTRILQISYELEITAKVSGMHTNLCVTIPIFIGTSPILFTNDNTTLNNCFIQPSAPVYDEEMDHGTSFFECNVQEIGEHPPPYSSIQPSFPVSFLTQNEYSSGQMYPGSSSIHAQQNVHTAQGFPEMSNIQITQNMNSAQVIPYYNYPNNF